jgi:DNA-directed RNA polymerase subunit RPC12/RpoP
MADEPGIIPEQLATFHNSIAHAQFGPEGALAAHRRGAEMAIKMRCSQCGKLMHVPDGSEGRRGHCPACGNPIVVPQRGESSGAAPKPGVPTVGSALDDRASRNPSTQEGKPSVEPGDGSVKEAVAISESLREAGVFDVKRCRVDIAEAIGQFWRLYLRNWFVATGFFVIVFGIVFTANLPFLIVAGLLFINAAGSVLIGSPVVPVVDLTLFFVALAVCGGVFLIWNLLVKALVLCLGINFGLSVARGKSSPLLDAFTVRHCYWKVLGIEALAAVVAISILVAAGFLVSSLPFASIAMSFVQFIIFVAIQLLSCLAAYPVADRRMPIMAAVRTSLEIVWDNRTLAIFAFLLPGSVLLVLNQYLPRLAGPIPALIVFALVLAFVIPYWFILGAIVYLKATGERIAA